MQIESEAGQQMVIDTDKWLLSQEERSHLRIANARLVDEKNRLRSLLNGWQGVAQGALGNVQKLAKEMQIYLRDVS